MNPTSGEHANSEGEAGAKSAAESTGLASESPAERLTAAGFGRALAKLRPRKARPFYGRHPWVLDSAIAGLDGPAADGDVVDLVAENGKFVARGLYNSRSRIRVRLYSWDPLAPLDNIFFGAKIDAALAARRDLGYDNPRGACRLIFSEGDGLSGLVVDRYADWLCVQVTALAIGVRLTSIVEQLAARCQPRGIMLRTEKGVSKAEGFELRDGCVWGETPSGPILIEEGGLRYGVDLAEGQKTGFYLDQRDNRVAAARYFRDRRVLDMFCYSGGFSLNAVKHGHAAEVIGFDSSAKAIALARANARTNDVTSARFEMSDCFDALDKLVGDGERFGAVVLDPPKFARSRKQVDDALRAYHRLNRLAVDALEPGGILVTCSCSGSVTREDFLLMLVGVAQQCRRPFQILELEERRPIIR